MEKRRKPTAKVPLPGNIDDEVAFHLEMRAKELQEEGLDAGAARREAHRRFGDMQHVKRDCLQIDTGFRRERRRAELLGDMLQDLSIGLRRLLKAPGFSLIAILILALGIGANSAIFSVLNAVVLQPLPYFEPDRLVEVWESEPSRGWDFFAMSELNYVDYRDGNQTFAELAAIGGRSVTLTGDGAATRLDALSVSSNFFSTIGVQPMLGRSFTTDEDTVGSDERVVVLGHELWQTRFGGDESIVGTSIVLNNAATTIIGVMPPGKTPMVAAQLYAPLRAGRNEMRSDHNLSIVGRLRAGVTVEQAEADLDTVAARLAKEYPESNEGFDTRVMLLYDSVVPDSVRSALYILLGAVGLVLLIACANLSSLLLARATARQREIAIYSALGASRARVVRQFLTEALLLAMLGGVAGMALAYLGVGWFRALDPARLPRFDTLAVDGTVLGFTLATAMLTGVLAGLIPAWQAAACDPQEALKEGGRGAGGSRGARRARQMLLVTEVALSIVLLAGAGLLIRSFWEVQSVHPGLDTDNVLTMALSAPITSQEEYDARPDLYRQLLDEIAAVPGVVHAAAISGLPFGGGNTSMDFQVEGAVPEPGAAVPSAFWRLVTPDYFATLRIPLVRGRWFGDSDGDAGEGFAVISQSMAEQHWPGEDPIGKRFLGWRDPERVKTVIGVVGDLRERDLETEARHMVYMPFYELPFWANMYVLARTETDPLQAATAIRTAIQRVAPDKPVTSIRAMAEVLDDTLAARRFNTLLLLIFAAVALVLAAAGVYGVMAYSVAQRGSEIGVRMAMGARTSHVMRMVIQQGMGMVGIGVVIGLAAAFGLTRLLGSMLYGVAPIDAVSLGAAIAFLLAVALAACALPALRATRIDPVSALRDS